MHDEEEYEVGYGKPPKRSRYRPGRSGNPKGRPKGSTSFSSTFHKLCQQKVTVLVDGVKQQMTKAEAAMAQIINKAAGGDMKAMKELIRLSQMFPYDENQRNIQRIINIHFNDDPNVPPAKIEYVPLMN